MRRARVPPGSAPVGRGLPRPGRIEPQSGEPLVAGARELPLPPEDTAQSPSYPAIEFLQRTLALRQTEVSHPSPQKRVEVLDRARYRLTTSLTQQLAHTFYKPPHALRGDPDARIAMGRDAVAQELALPRSLHRALGFVNAQSQDLLEEGPDSTHHPLPRRFASDIDVAVVRVAAERQAARLQFPVQVREQNVAKQWG